MPQPHRTAPFATARAFALAATAAGLAAVAAAPAAQAATLYDPALGTLPTAQGWSVLASGTAAASQSVAAGRYRLDTTGAGVSAYGNAISTALDTAAGFDLRFTLQVVNESHDSANRAGYSVVMVGSDPSKALELSFWSDQVWAADYVASDADRFVHGAGAAVDNTAAPHDWLLSVRNQQFALAADGSVLLAGSLRNYTAAGLPYNVPNFLFFGDDSSRGVSVTQLGLVSVSAVPEPAAAWLALAGGALLWLRRRRR